MDQQPIPALLADNQPVRLEDKIGHQMGQQEEIKHGFPFGETSGVLRIAVATI